MKKIKLVFVLLASLLLFCSCDKTKTDIKLSSMSFELNDIQVVSATRGDLNTFAATRTISLEDIQGITDEAIKYRKKIESITVGPTTSITITSTDGSGTVVKDFGLTASAVTHGVSVSQYDLGTTYSGGTLESFVIAVLNNLFQSNSATLNAQGKTDIPSGETLKVKITISEVILTAGIF